MLTIRRTEAGAGQHAEGPSQGGGLVAEDVAEEVLAQQNVELGRPQQQLHGAVVDEHVLEGHVGEFAGDAGDHLAPQHAVFQHVGLVDAGELLAAQLGGLEADAGDALDLRGGVHHGVDGAGLAIAEVFGLLGLTEVQAAGEFTDDQDVDAVALTLGAQRAGMSQGLGQTHRTEIGEEAELLADTQQGGALGALFLRDGRVAVGQAHRAEQNGIGAAAQLERGVGQGLARGVNAGPADGRLGDVELQGKLVAHGTEDAQGLPHDFRADAIASQRGDPISIGTHVRGAVCEEQAARESAFMDPQ